MARRSIARSLALGLIGVGALGLAVLLGAILLDYHITFVALREPQAFHLALRELAAHVLLPALVMALPMGLAGWWIVRWSLRPITLAAREVERTSSAEAGVRIDASDFPSEIVPLAEGVNALLGRVEGLAERNAAFAGDVAHELRTPLTLLGLELERLEDPKATALLGQVRAMQQLVNQLLLIARIDRPEQQQVAGKPVDLGRLAEGIVVQMVPAALASGRTIALEQPGPAIVMGEEQSLGAALRNLVENALRVTPEGGTVTVIAGPGGRLAVADGGPGLSEAELVRLSDRHARAGNASRDGAGLGLAIVSKILAIHGGRLLTRPEQRQLVMEFPVAA